MTVKSATGPGFRDLLRFPSGFGGRPGGSLRPGGRIATRDARRDRETIGDG
jgi:hypothetical protein